MSFRAPILLARSRFVPVAARSVALARPIVPVAHSLRRFTTEQTKEEPKKSGNGTFWFLAAAAAAAGGYYYYTTQEKQEAAPAAAPPKPLDYKEVYKAIADLLDDNDYDDGSFGPVFVRLAWHAAGTYDKTTGTGGSNGATMRFNPEASHGANNGLNVARQRLEKVKEQFPQISYSDLWSLAGVVAIQEMGGPTIKWRPGRSDAASAEACTPDGRLPDASQAQDHLRSIFYRMGFNDQEIVALSGAHALGRCHTDRSGFEGPWTFSPITFSNDYFKLLLSERWIDRKWDGPKQLADKKTGSLMMLPTDISLIKDRVFYKFVQLYAKDQDKFFEDFAAVFQKLEELGVPFAADAPVYEFPRL
ncbi:heme peroxidase [Polychytrium aggregatum]|uniref:heme peroxidase n=1 Tax=Polychytrium aggregatum TaxID=110093 RepID=UPI0022FECE92|nr:heme peroxidase [Polychytrium aggregatum]KAI9206756.1 heme peroxidase [Polychytrium aggregatum]